jgi:DUF1365 family protein
MNKHQRIIEVNEHDFILNPKARESAENEYYCLSETGDFIDSNKNARVLEGNIDKALAKKILREDGSIRYLVKINNTGKLYNPVSIYGQEKTRTFLDKVCKTESKFRDVNAKAFDLYISFLNSKNLSYLHNAERELG